MQEILNIKNFRWRSSDIHALCRIWRVYISFHISQATSFCLAFHELYHSIPTKIESLYIWRPSLLFGLAWPILTCLHRISFSYCFYPIFTPCYKKYKMKLYELLQKSNIECVLTCSTNWFSNNRFGCKKKEVLSPLFMQTMGKPAEREVEQLWEGKYPPPSFRSLVSITLVPCDTYESTLCILLYGIMDIMDSLPERSVSIINSWIDCVPKVENLWNVQKQTEIILTHWWLDTF